MHQLLEYWRDVLRSDLAGFADPGTLVEVDITGTELSARWRLRNRQFAESFFVDNSGDFRWHDNAGGAHRTYPDFLSSATMANFDHLSYAITRRFPLLDHYTPTKAQLSNGSSTDALPYSDELLFDTVNKSLSLRSGKTQLIFVKGDAGAGKTTLLERVTSLQASRYRSSPINQYVFLYVSAQGRALSNLKDALAAETGDLRATFTWDAIAPLTRRGLLVPIIDGFDELLGAAGYGDAFGSLREFLSDLNGSGVVVVSARSSFYDVEFVGRQSDAPTEAIYDLIPITLRRWSDQEIFTYLRKIEKPNEADLMDADILDELSDSDRELLGKPFFASKFPEYRRAIKNDKFDGSMIEFLIKSYIQREAEKIVDRDGRVLLPPGGHRRFFEETADLMWTNECRWLSKDDLRVLAELVAEESGLSADAASQLVTKITSYAGFAMTRSGQFAFEHDVYFDYFLSSVLKRQLLGTLNASHLDRGILPNEVAETAVNRVTVAERVFQQVLPTLDGSLRHENRRRNGGLLVAVAAQILGTVSGQSLHHLSMVNVDLDGVEFEDVEFAESTFQGVSLKDTKFRRCRCVNTHAYSISLSSQTILDLAGLEPGVNLHSISVIGEGGEEFSPRKMREILRGLGAPVATTAPEEISYSEEQMELISLLSRVVHKYRRTNVLCVEDDPGTSAIAHNTLWPTLKRIMIDSEVVRQETRATSGRRKEFLRPVVSMEDLAAYEATRKLPGGPIGSFWSELRKHGT